jgi:hypothetical protein
MKKYLRRRIDRKIANTAPQESLVSPESSAGKRCLCPARHQGHEFPQKFFAHMRCFPREIRSYYNAQVVARASVRAASASQHDLI